MPGKILKAIKILFYRIKEQGFYVTTLWFIGRIIPGVTGIPNLKYCRISPELYVGSQFSKDGKKVLEIEGISAVVNMRKEFDDLSKGLWRGKYCYLPTVDDTAPSLSQLEEGVRFIENEISAGEKVYIHCGAGVGRAPTMAAAYLIDQGLSLPEAIELIKRTRPFIHIMPEQLMQLEKYEAMIKERRKS